MSSPLDPQLTDQLQPFKRIGFTREDCVRYADASGDRNPVHLDPAAAHAAQLPDCVVHGMLIAGQFENAVRNWLGDVWLAESATRFVQPLLVNRDIVISGQIVRRIPDRSEVILRLVVRDIADQVICIADVRASLPGHDTGQ